MSKISILSDPFECPDCDVACEAIVTYDELLRERVDAWRCPNCEADFYRDSGDGVQMRGLARRLSRRARGLFK